MSDGTGLYEQAHYGFNFPCYHQGDVSCIRYT